MKRIYLYLVLFVGIFVFSAVPALAQDDYAVQGVVLDEYEKPIEGASVKAEGIDKTVVTDKDGKYIIIVPQKTKLVISHVGYKTTTTTGGRVKLKAQTTSVQEVAVVSKKKQQDYKKVKLVDPKAVITAVDTLLKRMPTAPPSGNYDTTIVHDYIKKEVYERFKDNAEVMTGVANAYYQYQGERRNWNIEGVTYPDTFLIYNRFCSDSIHTFRYIDYAITADSTYGKSYELAGNIHRDEGRYLDAMKWYKRGIKANPKTPDCYLAFARLVINNDTTSALNTLRTLAKNDSLYPVNLELARMYYDIDQLAYAYDFYDAAFWKDSTKRNYFKENDLLQYLAASQVTYNLTYGRAINRMKKGVKRDSVELAIINNANILTNRFYDVSCYGLDKYPESEGMIRQAFYLTQRLGLNDTSKVYAEKLYAMPNVKLITDDYLTYAKLYAAMGDLASADRKYNEAFAMCLTQSDEVRKEAEVTESDLKVQRLTRQLENLKNNEDVIIQEHIALYGEEHDKKINIAQFYISKKKEFGRKDYLEELNQLGATLAKKAAVVDSSEMVNVWKQVDAVYTEMAEVAPENLDMSIYYRLLVIMNIDNVQDTNDYGFDFCQRIVTENQDQFLTLKGLALENIKTSYDYLIRYHYSKWIKEGGKRNNRRSEHWKKLDEYSGNLMMIDPSNALATQVSNNIY